MLVVHDLVKLMEEEAVTNSTGQIAIYQTDDGQVQLEVALEREMVWLSQAQMVALFGRDQSVSRHIRNALSEGEIAEKSNMQKMHIANSDRPVVFYDFDAVPLRGVSSIDWIPAFAGMTT